MLDRSDNKLSFKLTNRIGKNVTLDICADVPQGSVLEPRRTLSLELTMEALCVGFANNVNAIINVKGDLVKL